MTNIEIIKPGLATSVQDKGRQGYYHLGIPPSGAMDQTAYRKGNWLLGNDTGVASLECAIIGPSLQFNCDTLFCLTGADMKAKLEDKAIANNEVILAKNGQVLSLQFASKGARTYIAVAGGFDVPIVLGSRSTYVLGGLGGFQGRFLKTGDTLSLLSDDFDDTRIGKKITLDANKITGGEDNQLRITLGLYDYLVEDMSINDFLQTEWRVASEADRVGYRFKGDTKLQFKKRQQPFGAGDDPSNIVDACYPIGSIQVPSGKEPIILHRDAVSGGGYMMIGTVISADMDKVGRLPPNAAIKFNAIGLDEALMARSIYQDGLNKLKIHCLD